MLPFGAILLYSAMANAPLYSAIALPCFTIVTSLIVSMLQISGIRDDIREIRSDLKLLTGKVYELMGEKH
jgi:hypothetical protein